MSTAQPNPLAESGKPIFFPVHESGVFVVPPSARQREAVRVNARSLSVMQKEALVTTSRSGAAWRLASDEGAYLAGLDEAPCPLSFFATGVVSSYMTNMLAAVAEQRIDVGRIRLVLDNYYTMTGSALKGTMTAGAKDPALTVELESDTDAGALRALASNAVAAAPVNGLLNGILRSRFSLTHNGRSVAGASVAAIEGGSRADPDAQLDRAEPKSGDWSAVVRRGGKTPRLAHTVTLANDSLAEQQSRLLHVRAICTLRADGMFEVEQHLYNPHGSIFTFLCDDAPRSGRAPDASSYTAAGIAFCFMTQFGRYAAIARRNLDHCRVVQDLHWSLAGSAEPVETHVFVTSTEDDDFARKLLEMSEQTCFLHALCRTPLATQVAVRPYPPDASLPEARAPAA